ncbi:DNA repair protein RecN [Oceanithermus sp.]
MLERLEVQNLATLPEATLEPGPGLTALTGETGTGKSILVGALGLLLGAKADPGLIRPGTGALLVTAWVEGRPYSRRVTPARSVPRIDGEVVTLAELQAALEPHVAIHTQHAALALTRKSRHRQALDRLVDAGVRQAYETAYRRWSELEEELVRLEARVAERERRLDVLRFQLHEIEQVAPQTGELEELEVEARRLGHTDELMRHLGAVLDLIAASEENALDRIRTAGKELGQAARLVPELEPLAADLEAAEAALAAVAREAESYAAGLEADPERLEAVERRIAELQRLERKYGGDLEAVLAFADGLRREITELEGAEDRLEALRAERQAARQRLEEAAAVLSAARERAAGELGPRVEAELRALGMPQARFSVRVHPLPEPQPHGADEVGFFFAAGGDQEAAPVEKAASGGELSRIMLALALHTGADAPTVIFDEVDVGIGGEVAVAVAERLARLARERQVIVVTHLAQIAAAAGVHYRVVREGASAHLERLEGEARVRELARMLSGSYSETALEHARELLKP